MHSRFALTALVALLAASPGFAQTPAPVTGPPDGSRSSIYLSAVYTAGDTQPVAGGLKWRVFAEQPDPDGSYKLVAESSEASPLLILPDGAYVVHVAYGLAGASRRINLRGQSASERIVLNAGALRVIPMLGDTPVPVGRATIAVYVPDRNNPEGRLVVPNMKPTDVVGLPEGTYHIVSTLGDAASITSGGVASATNSIVTADLRVQAAKVTEGTLRHRAALMTLKLVNIAGGEALANTAFTVLTPGGDVIRELIGAFPSLVLAEGEYVAIARNEGRTFQSVFKVQSTVDRDVEIKTR